MPRNKMLSYNCYNNGIEVYKEGRERGHFFSGKDSGAVELFGICLGFLLGSSADKCVASVEFNCSTRQNENCRSKSLYKIINNDRKQHDQSL